MWKILFSPWIRGFYGSFFLVAGFLISHLLLNSCFLGTLKKGAHQKKVGLYLWAAWFYLQLVCGGCLGSTGHARRISVRAVQLPRSRDLGHFSLKILGQLWYHGATALSDKQSLLQGEKKIWKITRHDDRQKPLRNGHAHLDPLCDGKGSSGQRDRGAHAAAELHADCHQSHLLRSAQGRPGQLVSLGEQVRVHKPAQVECGQSCRS